MSSKNIILAPSPNFDERPVAVDFLVLHYTGMVSAEAALARLCDPAAKVSAHYLIDEDGTVYQLVEEQKRAWHAGVSFWHGASGLNDRSIGVEIVNPGHEFGYRGFPDLQMEAVRKLCLAIIGRHHIKPQHVLGHSDIAPDRKQDPGELFPWAWLAAEGVGLWTDGFAEGGDLLPDLAAIGYDVRLRRDDVVRAFQRHYLPQRVSGLADEQTLGRAAAVRRMVEMA